MDNKTKVKVAVVIGIVILAVIFIFMIIFVKGNKPSVNKDIPVKASNSYSNKDENTVGNYSEDNDDNQGNQTNVNDMVSIGIKDNNLVKINSDLSSTTIKKLENGYIDFCYGDNKVYVVLNNEDGSYSISEIDLLKNDYSEKVVLTSSEYGSINNIEYYSGKLYFVTEKGQLIEYSISEEFARNLTNENEVSYFVVDEKNNRLFVSYRPNGENPGIYILDFTANNYTQVVTLNDLTGELILNGNSLVIDVKELSKLYLYNSEKSSIVEIGDDNKLNEAKNQVAFYDNGLLYTNGVTIDIKDTSGNSYKDGWYTLNDNTIAGISMISSNKFQIARYDENGKVTRSIVIDLSNGDTTEMNDTVYSDLKIIK